VLINTGGASPSPVHPLTVWVQTGGMNVVASPHSQDLWHPWCLAESRNDFVSFSLCNKTQTVNVGATSYVMAVMAIMAKKVTKINCDLYLLLPLVL
jgi:hypothetical protein